MVPNLSLYGKWLAPSWTRPRAKHDMYRLQSLQVGKTQMCEIPLPFPYANSPSFLYSVVIPCPLFLRTYLLFPPLLIPFTPLLSISCSKAAPPQIQLMTLGSAPATANAYFCGISLLPLEPRKRMW